MVLTFYWSNYFSLSGFVYFLVLKPMDMQLKNISLLSEKIRELRTALFFCDNPHDLPYPSYLVELAAMDEQGRVSFSINKHNGCNTREEAVFPVRLEFYRKAVPYTIDIKGNASIKSAGNGKVWVITVEIERLHYNQFTAAANTPPLQTIGNVFKHIFDIPGPLDRYAVFE